MHLQISAVSWGTNRLDIFGLGQDNAMYHKLGMVIVGFHLKMTGNDLVECSLVHQQLLHGEPTD